MKFTRLTMVCAIIASLIFVTGLNLGAASAAQSLAPLVAQLAQHPDDNELRMRIIRLANSLPHPPKIPPEFQIQMGGAIDAFENAKSDAAFVASLEAFKKASLLAPWVADVYLSIALADEKIQNYAEAITNLNLFLTASPKASEDSRAKILQHIGADQRRQQEAAAAQVARAANQQALTIVKTWLAGQLFFAAECQGGPAAAWASLETYVYAPPVQGCTDEELKGDHHWVEARPPSELMAIVTDDDVRIAQRSSPDKSMFVGVPQGADPQSIKWQCHGYDKTGQAVYWAAPFARLAAPGVAKSGGLIHGSYSYTFLAISCDPVAALAPGGIARYHYVLLLGSNYH